MLLSNEVRSKYHKELLMNSIDLAPDRDRLRAYVNMDSNEPSDSVNGQKCFDCLRAGLASHEGRRSLSVDMSIMVRPR